MDLDEVLAEIGEFGRYQKLILWFILLPCVLPCGFHAYNQLFMAARPDHWCRVPELEDLNYELAKNISIPLEEKDGEMQFSNCLMYDKNYSIEDNTYQESKIVRCENGWHYDKSIHHNSIIAEWNLVCDYDFLTTIALVIFGIAGLIGHFIFGYIQDRLGRKSSYFIYLLIATIFGLATAFANSFTMWLIFRFGVGFTIPSIIATPTILSIELVGPKYRSTVTLLINIAFSFGLVLLSAVVWLIRDWRYMAISTTVPFVLLFFFYFIMPESPRWLLSRGEFSKAERILQKMARVNKKTSKMACVYRLKEFKSEEPCETSSTKFGMTDLFKYPKLRMKTIIITFIWFTNTSVYVGLSYYAPALGGDEFLNFFLAGASEFPTYIFLWPAMDRVGRRWILFFSMVIGGISCVSTLLVNNYSSVRLGLYCIGKMGISSSFVVLPLMATEIYPTVVRGIGMSLSAVAGMLGPVCIPLINHLGSHALTLPLIIMGTLLIAGGVCSLLLPETLHRHLPQTLEDGEKDGLTDFGWCKKYKKAPSECECNN